MPKKTITIEGNTYKIRYTYKRDDGTLWHVLLVDGGFYGEFGDEWPVSQTVFIPA